eukprot:TRINITY_DN90734_c0_g1_i1.p1 TRINITY_DN90734_c0_g1~~TRINITY_DN90734_c0_g1_i1.p1  ORF type:complete len:626 (+),score=180.08 TRINITY_DN90734_c0_g1_i1:110-1987(+)
MAPAEAKLKGVIKLGPGSKVEVKGLENSKELNGLNGHLLQFDPVKMRWGVELETGKKVALKMANLIPLSQDLEAAVEVPNVGPMAAETVANLGGYAAAARQAAEPAVAAVETSEAKAAAGPPPQAVEVQEVVQPSSPPPAENVEETPAAPEAGESAAPEPQGAAAEAEADAEEGPPDLDDENAWPVLPTSAETQAKIRSGVWWDGGSAAKRFTEQLLANDATLLSCVLVPPKRFNEEDAREICDALEANNVCTELIASGHPLSQESCERLATMLGKNQTLRTLSVGEESLGALASVLFEGLAENHSLTALDLEHKGMTLEVCKSLAASLTKRKSNPATPPLGSLRLSRNHAIGAALLDGVVFEAPKKLQLCECGLRAEHGKALGAWICRGVEDLDLRDNSSFGGDGLEALLNALLPKKGDPSPPLRRLRLDGCAIGDDGLETLGDAYARGLEVEDLFFERCEVTLAGCQFLADALRGRRLEMLSARANVIGDQGCILLARCADKLDLSSTNLSGQILGTLGEQGLVSLELFSNPALGPSVETWCVELDSAHWQRLEYLDLTGVGITDAGFECVCNTLIERPDLMPNLKDLLIGANDIKEDDAKCELVDKLGAARGGKLTTKWCNN